MTNDFEATEAILDWSAIFMRLSMNDFLRFSRSAGFSFMQMALSMHLHYKGPTEVMACGELLQLSPAGASQMIERLVQQGLAQRSETPDDRRVRLVHLTRAGRQIVGASIEAQQGWLEAAGGCARRRTTRGGHGDAALADGAGAAPGNYLTHSEDKMIRNQWYAILESSEVRRGKPVGVTRMGEKLVAWRNRRAKWR